MIVGLFAVAVSFSTPPRAEESERSRARISLSPSQVTALREALRADSAAASAFEPVKKLAGEALKENPFPVRKIVSEGRLHSDPEKIRSLKARRDLPKAEALGYAYALTGETEYGEKAREFTLAWARTYEPDGNPINESEFVRLMKGYDLTRAVYTPRERTEVDRWLLRVAERHKAAIRPTSSTSKNNHHSHRLKIVGHVAFLLAPPDLIRWVVSDTRRHLNVNLYPDGSTFDFRQRDALHYHVYDLLPLIELAIAADKNRVDLYAHATPEGAGLEKSIAFLIPYISGEKTHLEFVHSSVKFDLQRSTAGDPSIQVGEKWNPKKARTLFDLAGYFQPNFHQVKIPGEDGAPSFERLLATYR
ncbi:MAG: alginate lyase family protein [Candidatus Binatia bacterium]